MYGPQKGASPQQVAELERRLAALELASAGRPGAGAGGGIGAMLMELGAEAVPGARLVLDEVGFDRSLAGADLCITGEGRIDGQTLRGKVVSAVAERCRSAGVACIAVGGIVEPERGRTRSRSWAPTRCSRATSRRPAPSWPRGYCAVAGCEAGAGSVNPPIFSSTAIRSSSGGCVSNIPPRLERSPLWSRSGDSM